MTDCIEVDHLITLVEQQKQNASSTIHFSEWTKKPPHYIDGVVPCIVLGTLRNDAVFFYDAHRRIPRRDVVS
jgi:hypothetical protein